MELKFRCVFFFIHSTEYVSGMGGSGWVAAGAGAAAGAAAVG
ncbi:MAG: hypothetical protein ACYSUT_12710 [Planctomycetota bacterium]